MDVAVGVRRTSTSPGGSTIEASNCFFDHPLGPGSPGRPEVVINVLSHADDV